MKRPIVVWLLVAVALIGVMTLVEQASSGPNHRSAHDDSLDDDEPSDFHRRGSAKYSDDRDDDYRRPAHSGKLDGEARALKERPASKGGKRKAARMHPANERDKVKLDEEGGNDEHGHMDSLCGRKLKVDPQGMGDKEILAASVLAKEGMLISRALVALYGEQVARCFFSMASAAKELVANDPDSLERQSAVGDFLGSIFGRSFGKGFDDVTYNMQQGIQKAIPAVGAVTQGIASISNGVVGIVAGGSGNDEKKVEEVKAEAKKAEEKKVEEKKAEVKKVDEKKAEVKKAEEKKKDEKKVEEKSSADKTKSNSVAAVPEKSESKVRAESKHKASEDSSKSSSESDSPKKSHSFHLKKMDSSRERCEICKARCFL